AGRTIDDLRIELDDLDHRADELTAACPGGLPDTWTWDGDPAAHIEGLRTNLNAITTDLARMTSAHQVRRAGVPSIAEAVEATSAARAQLADIESFAADIELTRQFLESAEAEVNRDIAPRRAAAIGAQLAPVTNGRYDDVRVNPSDLAVTVRDHMQRWRPATGLSHGTAEQIYL